MLSPLLLSLSPFPAPPIFQLFLEHLFKKLPVPHVPCLSTKSPGHFNAGPEMRRAATFRNFSPPSTKVSTKGQRKRPWTAEQGLDGGQESSPAAQPQGDLPGGVGPVLHGRPGSPAVSPQTSPHVPLSLRWTHLIQWGHTGQGPLLLDSVWDREATG